MRKEHGRGWGARDEGESDIMLFPLAYFKKISQIKREVLVRNIPKRIPIHRSMVTCSFHDHIQVRVDWVIIFCVL